MNQIDQSHVSQRIYYHSNQTTIAQILLPDWLYSNWSRNQSKDSDIATSYWKTGLLKVANAVDSCYKTKSLGPEKLLCKYQNAVKSGLLKWYDTKTVFTLVSGKITLSWQDFLILVFYYTLNQKSKFPSDTFSYHLRNI